ncbi:MAG: protein kinase domain-containing protein [Pyrinomonadaceae bacterium]
MDQAEDLWEPGKVILNEFLIEGRLGEGGFGAVALVRSQRSGERFAVKRSRLANIVSRDRFLAELRHWINLPAHPHLAACRFLRTVGDEVAIFAEYVSGGSLSDWLQSGRLYKGGPGQAVERILDIAIQSAWGLHAAHMLGLVHQDIKPANVLLTTEGVAKITDFGLAAGRRQSPEERTFQEALLRGLSQYLPDEDRAKALMLKAADRALRAMHDHYQKPTGPAPNGQTAVSAHGVFTRAYASPEQVEGRELNRRTDIWSWGLTVLEMFSGSRTWPSGTLAEPVLENLLREPVDPPIPPMPGRVAELLRKCFQENPEDRWASLDETAQILKVIYHEECGREYPRPRPPTRGLEELIADQLRSHRTRQWGDPREWLRVAYETVGEDPAKAVEKWPVRLGTPKAQAVADLGALEEARRLLESALGTVDPALQSALGQLCGEIASVHKSLGDAPEALREYDRGISILERLDDRSARLNLAVSVNRSAVLLRASGRREEALAACDRSIQLCEELAADGNEQSQKILANAFAIKGNAISDRQAALEFYDKALQIMDEQEDAEARVRTLVSKASTLEDLGARQEARTLWAVAEELLGRLFDHGRGDLRHILATGKLNRAKAAEALEDKLKFAQEAIELYSHLIAEEGHLEITGNLGDAYFWAGMSMEFLSRPHDALTYYARSRELLTQAVIREGRSDLADEMARSLSYESTLARELGDPHAATELAHKAVELWQNLVHLEGRQVWGLQLANAKKTLGTHLKQAGQIEPALDQLEEAIDLFGAPQGLHSETDKLLLAMALMEKASALRESGDFEHAIGDFQQALDIAWPLTGDEARHGVALILFNLSNAFADAGDLENAVSSLNEAIPIWEELTESGEVRWRVDLARAHTNMTDRVLKMESLEAASAYAERGLELFEQLVYEEGRDDLAIDMAKLLCGAGRIHKRLFHLEEAIAYWERALKALDRAQPSPERDELASVVTQSIPFLRALLGAKPDKFAGWGQLAATLVSQAEQQSDSGDSYGACDEFDEPIGIFMQLSRAAEDPHFLEACAETCHLKAEAAMDARRPYAGDDAFRLMITLYDTLLQDHGRADLIELWAGAHVAYASLLALHGHEADAEAVAAKMKEYLKAHHEAQHDRLSSEMDRMLAEMRDPET